LIFKDLVKSLSPKRNNVYDIEIASIMIRNKIKEIATVNEKDFKGIEGISVYRI